MKYLTITAVIGAIVLAIGMKVLVGQNRDLSARLNESEGKVTALSDARARDATMYRKRNAARVAELKRKEAENANLRKALAEAPVWAGSDVPAGIADALGMPSTAQE